MSLKHGLLGLLNYGDKTGYELTKAFADSLAFFWQAQMSQIYRELNAMEKEGLLTSRAVIQTDKPNKRVYSITETGRAELNEWLKKDLTGELAATKNAFLMQLFFSAGKGKAETLEMLKKARDSYFSVIQKSKEIAGSIEQYGEALCPEEGPLYWEMTAWFGYAYYRMCYQWLCDCIDRLESGEWEESR